MPKPGPPSPPPGTPTCSPKSGMEAARRRSGVRIRTPDRASDAWFFREDSGGTLHLMIDIEESSQAGRIRLCIRQFDVSLEPWLQRGTRKPAEAETPAAGTAGPTRLQRPAQPALRDSAECRERFVREPSRRLQVPHVSRLIRCPRFQPPRGRRAVAGANDTSTPRSSGRRSPRSACTAGAAARSNGNRRSSRNGRGTPAHIPPPASWPASWPAAPASASSSWR